MGRVARGSTEPGGVGEFTVLKSKPNSDKALLLLRTIHTRVKPIMKKHGWALPTLSEFFPKQSNLLGLNVNGGAKICIRLRPHSSPDSFYDLERDLIGTMLHELVHNVRGPHDQIFYRKLDELQDEYDHLRAMGYTGEGFLGHGERVGGRLPPSSRQASKEQAAKKAEERLRRSKLLGNSNGNRLGGLPTGLFTGKKRLSDLTAEAAERRRRDAGACGGCGCDSDLNASSSSASSSSSLSSTSNTTSHFPPEIRKEIERARKDSQVFVVDLTHEDDGEDDERKDAVVKKRMPSRTPDSDSESDLEIVEVSQPSHPSQGVPGLTSTASRKKAKLDTKTTTTTMGSGSFPTWACHLCTFVNMSPLLACEMCGAKRQTGRLPLSEGWVCHRCSVVTDHQFWTCIACGTVKLRS